MVKALAALGAFAVAACSPVDAAPDAPPAPVQAAAPSVHPESGLELIEVTVVSETGAHTFSTEVAASDAAQSRGLMFRTQLGDFEGMIFPSGTPSVRSFWMQNTPLPLDIIFIGPDRRILNIGEGVPYSTDSVLSDGPALAVFEIIGGRSEELGIRPGDLVEFELPE